MTDTPGFEEPNTPDEVQQNAEILPLAEIERRYLARVSKEQTGDRNALAAALGISKRTLYRKLGGL